MQNIQAKISYFTPSSNGHVAKSNFNEGNSKQYGSVGALLRWNQPPQILAMHIQPPSNCLHTHRPTLYTHLLTHPPLRVPQRTMR